MKTKWIGRDDGKNLPTVDVEVGAKKTAGSNKQVCNHACILSIISTNEKNMQKKTTNMEAK